MQQQQEHQKEGFAARSPLQPKGFSMHIKNRPLLL